MNIEPKSVAETPPPGFELSDRERMLLRQMLGEDFAGFSRGWDTEFGRSAGAKDYVVVSADVLQNEYQRNEVAGDKKYRGKRLALRGKIAEIKRGIGENYFLTLKGGSNQFIQPTAKMADGYVDYLAALEKDQDIRIFCKGNGMLMGSALADECIPADTWVEQMVSATLPELPKLIGSDETTTVEVITAVVVADRLKETSPCFLQATTLGDASCQQEISHLFEKQKTKKGKAAPPLSEAVTARLKTIPGAEPYLRKMANRAH